MINNKKIFIFIWLLLSNSVIALDLEKISVGLAWKHQFEFAGFYVAIKQGFYQDVGLDVKLFERKKNIILIDKVSNLSINYGVGGLSILSDIAKGEKIILLKALLQQSPWILLGKKSAILSSAKDIKGKRIMVAGQSSNLSLKILLNANKIDYDHGFVSIKHSFNIDDLVNNKVDLISAYISNQPYKLLQLGIEPVIFSTQDYGLDLYANLLFTSKEELDKHPLRVAKFVQATIKGYLWAFANINSAAKLVYDEYNTQNKTLAALVYEGEKLKKLAFYNNKPFGDINIERLKRIYNIYNFIGLKKKRLNYTDFVYQDSKTIIEKIKEFAKYNIDNNNLLFGMIGFLLIILIIILWNITLNKKINIAIKQKLKNERLIFRQNRIKEMETMMSGIAHQWRQPLTNISSTIMNIDLEFKNNTLNYQVLDEKLNNIENSINFMSTTIDDFSNYLKSNNNVVKFSINECINVALKLLSAEFLNHTIIIEHNQKNKIFYTGCRNELLQVIIIILNNAKDAMTNSNNERLIKINTKQTDVIQISISDNGCGIEAKYLKKIFKSSFSTSNKHAENGMGLYVAKSIIKDRFNGEIKVTSSVGLGTTFILVLRNYKMVKNG